MPAINDQAVDGFDKAKDGRAAGKRALLISSGSLVLGVMASGTTMLLRPYARTWVVDPEGLLFISGFMLLASFGVSMFLLATKAESVTAYITGLPLWRRRLCCLPYFAISVLLVGIFIGMFYMPGKKPLLVVFGTLALAFLNILLPLTWWRMRRCDASTPNE